MCKIIEYVWPRLNRGSEATRRELVESTIRTIDQIERAQWNPIDSILEESRQLFRREEERRKYADTKATIYLAVLAAVVPLSATLVKAFFNAFHTFKDWQFVTLILLFLLGTVYLLAAGIWAFRAIKVSVHHRIDVEDFIKLNNSEKIDVTLCKELLKAVRNNREYVNEKTSRVIMAHEFLVRMFILYVVLLILVGLMTAYPLLIRVIA